MGLLVPGRDTNNYCSAELVKGRATRPLCDPCFQTGSLTGPPWIPVGETNGRALDMWKAARRTYRRETGNQDLAIGECAIYRIRFSLSRDLAGARADSWGMVGKFSHLALVLGLSNTDHDGGAIPYDYRTRRAIQWIVNTR